MKQVKPAEPCQDQPAKKIAYSMSAGNWGDGKSISLWRTSKTESIKIARFQSDKTARLFAKEMGFPLSPALEKRLSNCDD